VVPRCTYCTFFREELFPLDSIVEGVKAITALGIRQVHLSGGSDLERGYDQEILAMVTAVRKVSDIDLEINLGPSYSRQTVRALKDLGVTSITSSLETFSDAVFQKTKPADSLAKRKELLEMAEAEGLMLRSMMLVGLGERDEDRIAQLFYLKGLKRLANLNFSRFLPFPGTAMAQQDRCSPWEVARLTAVARLVLPEVELGLAAGNTPDDIPLWYLAGGGNKLLGATVSQRDAKPQAGAKLIPLVPGLVVVSTLGSKAKIMEGLGRRVVFENLERKRSL